MQLTSRVRPLHALSALMLAGALALPLVAAAPASAAAPRSPKGWSREAVITNAQRWVDQRVPYSQTRWYRGYRQDCSGFVSMSWNIHASYPTGMMHQIAKPIRKSELKPGDVLLNAGKHVVLFERWSGRGQRYYIGYEQLSSTNRPVRRLIPYPYFRDQSRYRPYRFTGVPPKPQPKAARRPAAKPAAPSKPTLHPVSLRAEATQALAGAGRALPVSAFALALTLAGAAGLGWGLSGRGIR